MLAVQFDSKRVVVKDKPRPTGKGVVVRVRGCGICGSDLAILDSGFPVSGTPGHEISGELADGTPVAIEPVAPCGSCRYCETGNYQVCVHGPAMVYGVGKDGGMAEEILVEPRCIVPLPRSVDARIGFLVEPLAVAVHGVRRAGLYGGQRVLVVGGGSIGLAAVAAAVAAKAQVALVARHPAQIAAGRLLGAEIVESGAGGDYDVVLECADSASAVATACEAIRPNGTLVMLASSWGSLELPGLVVAAKELDIVIATMYGRAGAQRDVDTAAQILGERGDAIAEALVSHRFPLAKAAEAFAMARDRKAGAIKVVLEP
ncbi:alcohol dehydrogenase catalytic domain-containing protein [Myxococcota bacterium]|nr:alcohol dehydrogenase catalytic domain-containing protein [Myxococcota bacterium]